MVAEGKKREKGRENSAETFFGIAAILAVFGFITMASYTFKNDVLGKSERGGERGGAGGRG
jgi:hypothetical protein